LRSIKARAGALVTIAAMCDAAAADPTAQGASAASLVAALRRRLGATLIETHISWVLLDGEFAWKIKKPVRLAFLDFSRLDERKRLCEEELRLNRRLAPSWYLDVVPIAGTPDDPRPYGEGPAIEYALRMRQFPAGALLSERLAAGRLEGVQLDRLAQRLAAFHREAAVAGADTPWGAPSAIEHDALQVLDGLEARGAASACAPLRRWVLDEGCRLRVQWLSRKAEGHVREGHGDLHLANAVVLGEEVTAFDCIEFDPALRWMDVLNDIGFLAMDLLAHERGDLAYRFLNAYLDESGEHDGLPVLRYYMVYRALVRALVQRLSPSRAADADYLGLAQRLVAEPDARLLITHGVSGSGKSSVAARLLEQTQAIRLRSDVERKRLFGLRPLDDSGAAIYGHDAAQRTYARLRELAGTALRSGERVIVDAAFLRASERESFRSLAHECGVPFALLHCEAAPSVLRERVRARSECRDDPSEADVPVLERQLATQELLLPEELADALVVQTAQPWDTRQLAAEWLAPAHPALCEPMP
jgi:aminoglycoside phosphotransferase family enzyme/predicted kinase